MHAPALTSTGLQCSVIDRTGKYAHVRKKGAVERSLRSGVTKKPSRFRAWAAGPAGHQPGLHWTAEKSRCTEYYATMHNGTQVSRWKYTKTRTVHCSVAVRPCLRSTQHTAWHVKLTGLLASDAASEQEEKGCYHNEQAAQYALNIEHHEPLLRIHGPSGRCAIRSSRTRQSHLPPAPPAGPDCWVRQSPTLFRLPFPSRSRL